MKATTGKGNNAEREEREEKAEEEFDSAEKPKWECNLFYPLVIVMLTATATLIGGSYSIINVMKFAELDCEEQIAYVHYF